MTNECALYELKRKMPAKVFGTELYCKAYDIAIDALEKQIPKKPYKWAGKMLICPYCARAEYIRKIDMLDTYCGFCGQAIDWNEEE